MIKFTAAKNDKLVKYVLENIRDVSYSALMKLLRNKDVKINGKRVKSDCKLSAGDWVELYFSPEKSSAYTVIYSDENVIIINKKSGYASESVFNDLCEKERVYFIHRLDRNTSGVMVFAKNDKAGKELLSGFKNRLFEKTYTAFVFGKPQKNEEIKTAYLVKDKTNSTVKIFDEKVKSSVPIKTGYKLIDYKDGISKLSVRLYTGKTHQIRAHLAHLGLPIVGDGKYGDNKLNKAVGAKSQKLNADALTFHFKKEDILYYLDGKTFIAEEN